MSQDDPIQDAASLSLDDCLELLANRRRRIVVGFFHGSEIDIAPVDEIVSAIRAAEADATGERPERDAVEATLFHVHLPKFADAGVLEYDTRHLEVRYHGDPQLQTVYARVGELE